MSTQKIRRVRRPAVWDRLAYRADNCSIGRTLELIGDKWAIPILRDAFFGLTRFSDFERTLGCARNLLSARLTRLVDSGLLARSDYQEPGQRKRSEYQLTEKGAELLPVLIALMQWGDRWTADRAGPAIELKHRDCGATIGVQLVCREDHQHLQPRDILVTPGPGARLTESR